MQSDTLRIVGVFVASGVGFSGGSLLLARAMSPAEFGAFALLLAVTQVITPLGPLGVDVLVNRYRQRPGATMFTRVGLQSLLISFLVSWLAARHFSLSPAVACALFVAGFAGSVNRVAAAWYQCQHRHGRALWLSQSQNLAIFLAALVMLAGIGIEAGALYPACIVTAGYLLASLSGWSGLLSVRDAQTDTGRFARGLASAGTPCSALSFAEGLTVVGVGGAELLLVQADRLVIPSLLSMQELATYAVLVATMGAPFRVLQLAAGYATVPKIRAAGSIEQRWQVLRSEAALLCVVTAVGCVALWIATPWLVWLFVGDKYQLGSELILAAVIAGLARVLGAFSCAAVTAVGEQRHLLTLTLLSWGSVAVGVLGAVFGAQWGLTGVVYGVGMGWVMRAVGACLLLPASLNCKVFVPVAGAPTH